jgi:hypothetical protein
MAEYWVKMDISRRAALDVLDELATEKSELRRDLEKSKASARRALAERGIEVAESSLPDRIRLPAPDKVSALRTEARALVARDKKPFGFAVLLVVFGAMPLTDDAD